MKAGQEYEVELMRAGERIKVIDHARRTEVNMKG